MRRIPSDVRIGVLLLLAAAILTVVSPEKVLESFRENINLAGKILALATLAVGISIAIHYLMPEDFAIRRLGGNKARYLVYATLLGIVTPGPVYAVYPIVLALKKKGVQNQVLVSYITGQTIIGPARLPLEAGLFGLTFFVYRLIIAIGMGTAAGLLYILFSKKLPDEVWK